jgi:two-component system cell cycle response regulator
MPAGKPATPLCDQFGFDASWREAQLVLIGLGTFSREQVRLLHDKVLTRDTAATILDRFYQQLLQHTQAANLLSSFDIGHLKERQVQFFTDFGVRYKEAEYFESRARVGVAHARVGVPLSLYLASFGLLQNLILEVVLERMELREERQQLTELVVKLTSLDIALATEVYHRARMQELGRSLKHLEREQQHLRKQLEQDALTGVSSRTSLLRELAAAIGRAGKTGQPLVVMMADLDHFKNINDTHGHLVGDKVLREVAARIKAALREFDLVGRYGGEEFVILLENTSPHTAHQIAERIRQRIAGGPVQLGPVSVSVTISQGMALYGNNDDVQSLLKRSDEAMYRAKEAGRNCVVEED